MEIKIFRQIDTLGRLVIPADLRRQYGLYPGDELCFAADDKGIIIICSENKMYNNDKEK